MTRGEWMQHSHSSTVPSPTPGQRADVVVVVVKDAQWKLEYNPKQLWILKHKEIMTPEGIHFHVKSVKIG